MLKYLRYALATLCFAASVGCLALWWRSGSTTDLAISPYEVSPLRTLALKSAGGRLTLCHFVHRANQVDWRSISMPASDDPTLAFLPDDPTDWFGHHLKDYYFPHWYPALVFALAGVASLRLGRRFTLRSVIIATTAVAVLLGMAVIL
jgi:hypothetical protein